MIYSLFSMTDQHLCQRTYRRSIDQPWLVWWGLAPSDAGIFQCQLLTYAIFLRERIRVLSAKAATNSEAWRGLRRIADDGWRIYRVRCQTIEAATLFNNYHGEPAAECLKASAILVRCFDGAIRSNPRELEKLCSDIAWLRPRYMGELLDRLRLVYCPHESVGHPLDMVFWHLSPSVGVGVDVSVFEMERNGSLPLRMRGGQVLS